MKNNEIENANRKALPKFLVVAIICMVVGGITGYVSAKYGLDKMAIPMKDVCTFFGTNIAPWIMAVMVVVVPVVCIPIYQNAKKLLGTWDGEDEDIAESVERKLSVVIWFTSIALILDYFLMAASCSRGFEIFDNKKNTIVLFLGIIASVGIMIETIIFQQKCVDTIKQTNPEKKASVYDMKFQKKWLDDCDEAEKMIIGRCAFKAYLATNMVCTVLAIVLAVCALVFNIGFLPSLMVCLVWIINLSAYYKETMRYSKVV